MKATHTPQFDFLSFTFLKRKLPAAKSGTVVAAKRGFANPPVRVRSERCFLGLADRKEVRTGKAKDQIPAADHDGDFHREPKVLFHVEFIPQGVTRCPVQVCIDHMAHERMKHLLVLLREVLEGCANEENTGAEPEGHVGHQLHHIHCKLNSQGSCTNPERLLK